MKNSFKLLSRILIIGIVLISCNQNNISQNENESKFTNLKGPYLGQTPPGDTPELFASGIVADIFREHSSAAFTPDGEEVFWTRQGFFLNSDSSKSRLIVAMHMKQENGIWTQPELALFNMGMWTFIRQISSDGKNLYFRSSRPVNKSDTIPETRTWVVNKTSKGWSEPSIVELPKFKEEYKFQAKAKSGNLYLRRRAPNTGISLALYRSKFIEGTYQEPELLGESINSEYLDYGFYIDNDEKFIIFSSQRPGGHSSIDLYISYRQPDDSWSEAINLGEKINAHGIDGSDWPYMSPDGKYLFFMTTMKPVANIDKNQYTYDDLRKSQLSITNADSKIHWVSASFIEDLKPAHLR